MQNRILPEKKKKWNMWLLLLGIIFSLVIIELCLQIYSFAVSYNPVRKANDSAYVILALGESTTDELNLEYSSWPKELEKILNNKSLGKKRYIVYNEGQAATQSGIILSELEMNLNYYKPDMVITMIGINDYGERFREKRSILKLPSVIRWIRDSFLTLQKKKCIENRDIDPGALLNEFRAIAEIKHRENLDIEKELENECTTFKQLAEAYFRLGSYYEAIGDEGNKETSAYYYLKSAKYYEKNLQYNLNRAGNLMLSTIYFRLMRIYEGTDLEKKYFMIHRDYVKKAAYVETYPIQMDRSYFSEPERIALHQKNVLSENYNEISKRIHAKGIRHIAMQYPTLSLDELKESLNQNGNITFASNEENFRRYLKNYSYDDIFFDRITDNFGHAKLLGNRIIAENLAEIVLEISDNSGIKRIST